jgi:SAM-dependent methyltransferase
MSEAACETQWRRTPKFVLRHACIDEATAGWEPGRFVELGAGTGTLTRAFLDRGFTGVCFDLTPETREILRRNLAGRGDAVDVVDSADDIAPEAFDYLFAFEVLEHVEDDIQALREWTKWLRPGGLLLVSVPAHQRKYSRDDANVGHVRRYESDALRGLLTGAGYSDVELYNYGFPLGNLTRLSRRVIDLVRRRGADDGRSYAERSVDSGVKSSGAVLRIAPLVNDTTLAPFVAVQRRLYRRELGDGFVATAVKGG